MQNIDMKIEQWKKRLLDLGKRNRLINFKETKRSNVAIISPSYDIVYKRIVHEEDKLSFSFPLKTTYDENGEEINLNVERGDIETSKTLNEQQKTLKVLRARAKTSIEEQGINTLYLTFGIIRWKESDISDFVISSPLVLVPVSLTIESITEPYVLQLHEDEIVVNPSLAFKFENDFGIVLPEFDGHENDIEDYLLQIRKIAKKNEWEVITDVHLTLLSFLKINMYKDLDNNKDKIESNSTVKALSGDKSEIPIIPSELNNFNHDKNVRPIDTYQVVDADSSQQDAILLSKKGISFVLQGPPGTGKSQTITNIIAESIYDGKKVLFVSEKMAALEVVKKRLTEAGLDDFCLTLHSNKANKKEILEQLARTLNIQKISLREDAIYKLSVLEERRTKLNEYQEQLHEKCLPLNISIYEANGRLAKLSATQDIIFGISNIENVNIEVLNKYKYLLSEFSKIIGKQTEDYSQNPWYGCNVTVVSHELRHDIEVNLNILLLKLNNLIQTYECIIEKTGANISLTYRNIFSIIKLLDFSSESPIFPIDWLVEDSTMLVSCAREYSKLFYEHKEIKTNLLARYEEDILNLNANDIIFTIESNITDVKAYLNNTSFTSNKNIVLKADFIISECRDIKTIIEKLYNESKEIYSILDLKQQYSISSIIESKRLIELILKKPQPLEKWFDNGNLESITELLLIAESEHLVLKDNLKKIRVNYDDNILNIEFEEMLSRFKNSYFQVLKIISDYKNLSNVLSLNRETIFSFIDDQGQKIKEYKLVITNALEVSNQLTDIIGIKSISTLKELIYLDDLLSSITKNPKPTLVWFDESREFSIDKIISDIKNTQVEVEKETNQILNQYYKDILNVDYKNMLFRLTSENCNFIKYFECCFEACNEFKIRLAINKEDLYSFVDIQVNDLKIYILLLRKGYEASKNLTEILEMKSINTLKEIISFNKLLHQIIKAPKPTLAWFDDGKDTVIDKIAAEIKTVQDEIKEETHNILLKYNKGIFDIDYRGILFRFNSEYRKLIKHIKRNYRSDKKTVLGFCKEPNNKLADNEIITLLNKILQIKEKEKWIIENRQLAIETLGCLYNDDYTDWNIVEENRANFRCIKESFYANKIPEALKQLLIENKIESFKERYININEICENKNLEYIYTVFGKNCENILIDELLINMQEIVNVSSQMKEDFETVSNLQINNTDELSILGRKTNSKLTNWDIITLINNIKNIKEKEQWLLENKSLATDILGDLYMDNYTNWSMVEKCRANFKTIKDYFGANKIPEQLKKILIKNDTEQLITQYSIFSNITKTNVLDFLESIFGVNAGNQQILELIKEMNNTTNTLIEIKNDYLNICRYAAKSVEISKININDITEVLISIKEVDYKRKWISDNNINLIEKFGKHYNGEDTNWNIVKDRINVVEKIIEYFDKKQIPKRLINHLITCENMQDIFDIFKNDIEDIENKNIVTRLDNLLNIGNIEAVDFEKIICMLEVVEKGVNIGYSKYEKFSSYSKDTMQFETIVNDITLLSKIQEIEGKVSSQSYELKSKFDFAFKGMETDWNKVLFCLEYANKFSILSKEYSLSNDYISYICCDKSIAEWSIKYSEKLKNQEKDIKVYFDWFVNLFDNCEEFYYKSIYKILDRIEKCINNLSLLEEWIDFRSIRQQCRDNGLSEFVEKVEQMGMDSNLIVDTFFKRFYRLWLDIFIPGYPAICSFRSSSHQSIINEFNDLDKSQLEIGRLRILERLISRLPDTNIVTSSVDEVGILKRELTKQRKIMPLRRLFKAIPNLLTALKPCLMMSPLSVSLFLQADGYNFDTVIFDEASQVCTEDAIGAIMRGKQVIIAGDSKQLPPTSFFAATLSDGDFDIDTDDDVFDDTGVFDSILEEAINAIPERTLKWHYRSRHEDLIAFSNAKIYNNELITFPSNMEKVPHNGVEYIYVENGVYDRGAKKHNLNEARRVAGLVFEHIRKYPKRSLGVVTFSEAQQQAIDNAIRQLRLQNNQYENFFSEDKDHPFFIKNLENVQGDERDTIIFSIGYAKDQNGVMYMNFGPLSRNGGYRRLNVAITRAKYNVKLVGSIHPTDIKIENINSGVKMLRQYIEFAINGASVLKNELQFTNTVNVESPFEEAIYDFLIKSGYNVTTQVGCSGYRIDMAIKHPSLSGIFVLGIECDGATYHSARTARERDRLRQTVLEDIGWTIYRVWSTDWIKDPKNEGVKLLEAAEMAISKYRMDNIFIRNDEIASKDTLAVKEAYLTVEKPKENKSNDNNPYNFNYYKETDIFKFTGASNDNQYLAKVIDYVVEQEYPIHYELLCKRVAPLFGNQKATVKVRNSVEYVLNKNLRDVVIKKGDFCWYKNVKDIKAKIPPLYGDCRTINYISIEELAEAMIVIARKSFGITKNDLCVVTARVFGFNRTGGNITQSMEKACLYLLENGRVKEIDGKIVV